MEAVWVCVQVSNKVIVPTQYRYTCVQFPVILGGMHSMVLRHKLAKIIGGVCDLQSFPAITNICLFLIRSSDSPTNSSNIQ